MFIILSISRSYGQVYFDDILNKDINEFDRKFEVIGADFKSSSLIAKYIVNCQPNECDANVLRHILKKGFNPNIEYNGIKPLTFALWYDVDFSIINELVEGGSIIDFPLKNNQFMIASLPDNVVEFAYGKNNYLSTIYLIRKNVSLKKSRIKLNSHMKYISAIVNDEVDVVKSYLASGKSVGSDDLLMALMSGSPKTIELFSMLDLPLTIDDENSTHIQKNKSIIDTCKKYRIRIKPYNRSDDIFSLIGNLDQVEDSSAISYLISNGVEPSIEYVKSKLLNFQDAEELNDIKNYLASHCEKLWDFAFENNSISIVKVLATSGCDIQKGLNLATKYGETALVMVIKAVPDIQKEDIPWGYIVQEKQISLVKLLQDDGHDIPHEFMRDAIAYMPGLNINKIENIDSQTASSIMKTIIENDQREYYLIEYLIMTGNIENIKALNEKFGLFSKHRIPDSGIISKCTKEYYRESELSNYYQFKISLDISGGEMFVSNYAVFSLLMCEKHQRDDVKRYIRRTAGKKIHDIYLINDEMKGPNNQKFCKTIEE